MKKLAVYPGSFDPITNGHLDIIERAAALFDEVIVAILHNSAKNSLFTNEERKVQIAPLIKKFKNVKVDSFDGLLVDYMKKTKANVCIRGLRAVTDLDYEFTLASINKKLSPKMETIFLMPSEKNTYLSSSVVKEVYKFGGELKDSVPANIDKALKKKFKK
ncbi:MAG: pantetheine-phosphate adenylyltransferase [Elusimicrobiaceae bacterium]|nr:pantetheine-phosphate adenylyltransferase [Elusimicrobiaceae bacterium]